MSEFPNEMALLRHSVRLALDGDAGRLPLIRALREPANPHHTLWLARQHRASLCLHEALRQAALPSATGHPFARLQIVHEAHALRSLARAREIRLIQETFDRLRVRAICLAGSVLAHRHHPAPALRELGETTTFLLRPADRERAATALRETGYSLDDDPLRLSQLERSHPVLLTQLGAGVASADAAAWTECAWRRAESFSFGGSTLLLPSPADWLRHACTRGTASWRIDLSRAGDLVCALRSPSLVWPHLLAECDSRGDLAKILLGLAASHAALDVPLPAPLAEALQRKPALRRSAEALAAAARRGRLPARRVALRARLALDPGPRARLRIVCRHLRDLLLSRRVAEIAPQPDKPYLGRFAPTPPAAVVAMLRLAEVSAGDLVCDPGCGDGRVPIIAAEKFGARGWGIDIDAARVAEARAQAAAHGVTERVRFTCADALRENLRSASVVCLYLQAFAYPTLRRKLARELAPGTRIVSHDFIFPDWPPEKVHLLRTGPLQVSWLYLWRIGGRS